MIKNKKITKVLMSFIALITIVALIALMNNLDKGSKYYAKQFLEILATPEEAEFKKYYRTIFDSDNKTETEIQQNYINYVDLTKKEYGELMTKEAFDNAISNRLIPWDLLIKEDSNYTIEVDLIDVKKMSDYKDGRVHYAYSISLIVLFSNGKNETSTVSGDIVMIEENGRWIVDIFRWNSDYYNLYKMLPI